uniref:Orf254 n=1 Tax=White spot syndrome virus TaxID=92652 RepID=Q003J5_WSSV|nr:orf254 [White spot syndrome virus]
MAVNLDNVLVNINNKDEDLTKLVSEAIKRRAKTVFDTKNQAGFDMRRQVEAALYEAISKKKEKAIKAFDELIQERGDEITPLTTMQYEEWVNRTITPSLTTENLLGDVEHADFLLDRMTPVSEEDIEGFAASTFKEVSDSKTATVIVKADCETGDIDEVYNLAPSFGVTQEIKIYRSNNSSELDNVADSFHIYKISATDSDSGNTKKLLYGLRNKKAGYTCLCRIFAEIESDGIMANTNIGVAENNRDEIDENEEGKYGFLIPKQPAGAKLIIYFFLNCWP